MSEISTLNKFLVGVRGDRVLIMSGEAVSPAGLTPDDALLLGAYLVAMSEHMASHRFAEVLEAVQNA